VFAADGLPVPEARSHRVGRGNLEIRNIISDDAGLYHCALASQPDLFAEAMLTVTGE